MKLTTKNVIKLLPFSQELKDNLLANFESMDSNKKFMVEDVVWNTYYTIYKLKLEENLNLALLRAKNNQEKLDDKFYERVEDQTEKEMQEEGMKATEKFDLESARQAMENIVKEIQASKKKPKI